MHDKKLSSDSTYKVTSTRFGIRNDPLQKLNNDIAKSNYKNIIFIAMKASCKLQTIYSYNHNGKNGNIILLSLCAVMCQNKWFPFMAINLFKVKTSIKCIAQFSF